MLLEKALNVGAFNLMQDPLCDLREREIFVNAECALTRALRFVFRDFFGQVFCFKALAVAGDDPAFAERAELADVAGPRVPADQVHGFFGDNGCFQFIIPTRVLQEVSHEKGDVLRALAKRRKKDRKDVESVKQVFSESPCGHCFFQIHVCGRQYSDVDLNPIVPADPAEFHLLKHSKEVDLNVEGGFAQLVKKECSAMSHFEDALSSS